MKKPEFKMVDAYYLQRKQPGSQKQLQLSCPRVDAKGGCQTQTNK